MLTKTIGLALALALSLVACADLADEDLDHGTPVPVEVAETAQLAVEREGECPIVPENEPCAAACDREALDAFIQPGTCVIFLCHRDDGSEIYAGGCR